MEQTRLTAEKLLSSVLRRLCKDFCLSKCIDLRSLVSFVQLMPSNISYDLPLSGTRSLSVKEYRRDIMYTVVVKAGGRDSSNCPSYMINNFFNFSNCWMNSTIPGRSMVANRKIAPLKKSSFRPSNENLSSLVNEPSKTMPAVIALSSTVSFDLILIAVIIYWTRMKRHHCAIPNDQIEMDKLVCQIPESENQKRRRWKRLRVIKLSCTLFLLTIALFITK